MRRPAPALTERSRPGAWAVLYGAILLVLVACDSGTPGASTAVPDVTVAAAATTAPQPSATRGAAVATNTSAPVLSPTEDTSAASAYATITALARNAAATRTALAAPTSTSTPAPPPPPLPAADLGTYKLIVTARAEGFRVYQQPGTLVLSAAQPDSGHSAEVHIWTGVMRGRELADLSPGKAAGGLYLTTSAGTLPAKFPQAAGYNTSVVYDPTTQLLTILADPEHGLPGGWSTGPNNKARRPRPISGGKIVLTLGPPGHLSGQLDLTAAGEPPLIYAGGLQGVK
ncbi:MAG TPA: hypothetical protein VM536_22070 [Chloroflexia bacterium]|nr:hypothetical protein [Chloroflexia bacterium]